MKRLILFITLLFAGLVYANAQTVALPAMKAGFVWAQVTTPYTLNAATVRNFTISAPQMYATTQDFIVKLDTVVGTATQHATVAVAIYGQKSAIAGDWTQIGTTKTWYNTTADTVIILSNTTANRYSNYKFVYTGSNTSGAKTQITQQYLKLYLE